MTSSTQSDDAVMNAFAPFQAATISDAMFSLGLRDSALDPSVRLLAGRQLLGRARTVGRTPLTGNAGQAEMAGDYGFAIQQVIDGCKSGSVIVIATQGIASHANWGGNMAHRASHLGAVGLVTDGALRDADEMEGYGLTVFAQGTSVRAGQHRFATTVRNEPVICAGAYVRPDDIILGDRDGVIVIPPEHANDIARKAAELVGIEKEMQAFMDGGASLYDAVMKYKVR
ncbi:RraA family protein [Aquamicrobium ahrensii]|uniref:Putative 4-hydroxy-4-methyl-2-oxoglutarate aldolase n=1 Tax=Aquamicrobium ahrensii TaxID=469551 RepID=A0ABV2KRG3_9HYPH